MKTCGVHRCSNDFRQILLPLLPPHMNPPGRVYRKTAHHGNTPTLQHPSNTPTHSPEPHTHTHTHTHTRTFLPQTQLHPGTKGYKAKGYNTTSYSGWGGWASPSPIHYSTKNLQCSYYSDSYMSTYTSYCTPCYYFFHY